MSVSGMQMARFTMAMSQKALEVIGQNIANAQTPGYTRQELMTEIMAYGYSSSSIADDQIQYGSTIKEISRMRNEVLDGVFRSENIVYGQYEARADYMQEIADIFSDNSEYGLTSALNNFWEAWNDAAQAPESVSLRQNVVNMGDYLARSITSKAYRLKEMENRVDTDIKTTVDTINNYLNEIATININLTKSTSSNNTSNLLQDKKDYYLSQLSELIDIKTVNTSGESMNIYIDGNPVVVGRNVNEITLDKLDDGTYRILSSDGRELDAGGGKLEGYFQIKNEDLPNYKQQLDDWTTGMMDAINGIHKVGYGLTGTTGINFFSGTGYEDIAINITDPQDVALAVPSLTSTDNINVDDTTITLAQSLQAQSANFIVPPDASGTITVNGVAISWDETQTLNTIMENIAEQAGVKWYYDSVSQKMTLSAPDNSNTITVTDTTGNLSEVLQLDTAVLVKGTAGDGENGIRIYESRDSEFFGQAYSGTTTGNVAYVSSTKQTAIGTYNVTITQEAVQGEISGNVREVGQLAGTTGDGVSTGGAGDQLVIHGALLGTPVTLDVNGLNVSQIADAINADADLQTAGIYARVDGNNLVVEGGIGIGTTAGDVQVDVIDGGTGVIDDVTGMTIGNDQDLSAGTVGADSTLNRLGTNETLTFTDGDGHNITVNLTAGTLINDALSLVRNSLDGAGIPATLSFDNATSTFHFTNNAYGSVTNVKNTFRSSLSSTGNGLSIAVNANETITVADGSGGAGAVNNTVGHDVAGTIVNQATAVVSACTGVGRTLTANTGTETDGLILTVTATAPGLAGTVTTSVSESTQSMNDAYQNMISGIGFDANAAIDIASSQADFVASINEKIESISGVSVDEEMIDLMQYQRVFQAGAKMATIVDEMLETVMNIV